MTKIKQVQIVPAPDDYHLELEMSDGTTFTFRFEGAQQVADLAKDARQVVLLSTYHEEIEVDPDEIDEGDMFPFISGVVCATEFVEDEAGNRYLGVNLKEDGKFYDLYLDPDAKVTVLRRIQ